MSNANNASESSNINANVKLSEISSERFKTSLNENENENEDEIMDYDIDAKHWKIHTVYSSVTVNKIINNLPISMKITKPCIKFYAFLMTQFTRYLCQLVYWEYQKNKRLNIVDFDFISKIIHMDKMHFNLFWGTIVNIFRSQLGKFDFLLEDDLIKILRNTKMRENKKHILEGKKKFFLEDGNKNSKAKKNQTRTNTQTLDSYFNLN